MALLVMIMRKMVQNKWLEIGLLLGMLFTVALVSTMPIYSEAILSRMLVKDMESIQTDRGVYPGTHWSKINFGDTPAEKRQQIAAVIDPFMRNEAYAGFHLPVSQYVVERETETVRLIPADTTKVDPGVSREADIRNSFGLQEHIQIVDGRMPSGQPVDGVYEVMVTESALVQLKSVIDSVFLVKSDKLKGELSVKVVGVFAKKQDDDAYFRTPDMTDYDHSLLMNEQLFEQEITQKGLLPLYASGWYFVLDYTKMELRNVSNFVDTSALIQNRLASQINGFQIKSSVPALDTIEKYFDRATNLKKLMWSLNVPVLIMLGFYMFMVSNLIADRQKNEIAVLRSRGASRKQIMLSFVIEGLLLGTAAFLLGPIISMGLTKVLGASNGFLEFVDRSNLQVRLNTETYRYASIAVVCSIVMVLIPAVIATNVSIVGHKQNMARVQKTRMWHKYFLDIAVLAVAVYGLRTFQTRIKTMQSFGLNSGDLTIDPLQFVMPALFILGMGLLLLRFYPLLLRIIYFIGRKWWPPSLYATLIQVGRSNSQYQFLMVFLIMTIATGVFSASAARTINNNTEDRIRYANGTDVVLEIPWQDDAPPEMPGQPPPPRPPGRIHFMEPPVEPYTTLPGVEQSARVFVKQKASFFAGKGGGYATLMGIVTDDFGRTTWFRDSLLDHTLNDYLNLMAGDTKAVLISRSLAEQRNLKPGDPISVGWDGTDQQTFVVYGIIPYFPTFNPLPSGRAENNKPAEPMLIVGHLPHIQTHIALEPYRIWLKLKPGFSINTFYKELIDRKLPVINITDTPGALHKAKTDPFLLAINGVLTLGFLISILVSFVGFLLFWTLFLNGRTLQNGILRAVGISLKQLVGMLAAEQVLTSGAAIMIGIFTGIGSSRLFVPVFQTAFDPKTLVPPFRIVFDPADSVRLYTIVVVMMVLGLGILGWMLSQIKIHQAIKLGED